MEKVAHVTAGEKLSNRNLLCFSAGGVGRDMAYTLWNAYLLMCIMYTKSVTNSQLSIILIIMAVCRIWDAVNDPIMGGIIERTRTKWGKFKPWILIGAVSNAVVTFAIFAVPLKGQDFLIFFPFAYLIWDITYTMNDIGYWAMLPSLTSNDNDRNKLAMFANILAGIGAGITGIVIPIFTTGKLAIGGNAVTGYTVMAAVICSFLILCQLLTTLGVKEKPLPPCCGEKMGVKAMFKVIFKNDQLLWVALVMILYNLGSSLYSASLANYVLFRFGYAGVNIALFTTLGGILGGVSILFPWLSKRFTRKTIAAWSIGTACVGYALLFIIGSSTNSAANTQAIYVGLIAISALIAIGQSMFYMVLTISIANTIEYNEWKTGSRDEGIIFSVRPFMAKMGSALVVVVTAVIYGVLRVGDVTNRISDIENEAYIMLGQGTSAETVETFKQTQITAVLDGVAPNIRIWMLFGLTVIPMLFVIGGYTVWRLKYKINEKFYAEIVTENLERACGLGVDAEAVARGEGQLNAAEADVFSAAAGGEVPHYTPEDENADSDGEA